MRATGSHLRAKTPRLSGHYVSTRSASRNITTRESCQWGTARILAVAPSEVRARGIRRRRLRPMAIVNSLSLTRTLRLEVHCGDQRLGGGVDAVTHLYAIS